MVRHLVGESGTALEHEAEALAMAAGAFADLVLLRNGALMAPAPAEPGASQAEVRRAEDTPTTAALAGSLARDIAGRS